MRKSLFGLAAGAVLAAGCARSGAPSAARPAPVAVSAPSPETRPPSTNPTFTAVTIISGKVIVSNPKARFVVINLEPGVVPPVDTRLFAYRNGARVGELRVTGPQAEDKTVADIVTGDIRIDDQISDN